MGVFTSPIFFLLITSLFKLPIATWATPQMHPIELLAGGFFPTIAMLGYIIYQVTTHLPIRSERLRLPSGKHMKPNIHHVAPPVGKHVN